VRSRVEKVDSSKFILHVASVKVEEKDPHQFKIGDRDCTLIVKYGDHSKALKNVVEALKKVSSRVKVKIPSD
jgi:hypothetical protein